jgi:hypothetical protein
MSLLGEHNISSIQFRIMSCEVLGLQKMCNLCLAFCLQVTAEKMWWFSKPNNTMTFHFIMLHLLSLNNLVPTILCFEKYVIQMSPTIYQTLLQSS